MRFRQGLRLGAVAAVLTSVLVRPSWAAPPPVELETLRVGYTSQDRSNLFKIGTWTPVWIQLRAGAAGFSGYVEVVVPDDDETPTTFRQRVDVPAKGSQRFVSYARPGTHDPEFTIRLLDQRGWRVAPDVNGSSNVQLNPLQSDETLVLTLGKPQGVEQIPRIPGFDASRNTRGGTGSSEITVAGVDTLGGHLPGRWYGYDAASVVVLDTNDKQVMAELDAYRAPALEDWVRRGGHLVVSVGANWQAVRGGFLGAMLPAVPSGQEQVGSLDAIDAFTPGETKQITPPGSPKATVTKLEEVEARGGKVLSATSDLPLVVRGSYGFGRVTVIAFDVDQRPFSDWVDRPLFWVKALDLRRRTADAPGPAQVTGRGRRIFMTRVADLSSHLRKSLEQFPGVRLVPFGWVAFFIFLYILLIGPGDYLFLKKVLKRMELTWITFPLIVVSVSLLAYYAAYVVKGSELRVNQVDIVDVDQPTGLLRGNSWLNVFSPQNRDYKLEVIPLPLDREVPRDEKPARQAGTEVLVSWFGVPETGFGGMGQSGRLSFSSGGYEYQPAGAGEWLEGVRIPIWSTKCFNARWFGSTPQVADASLRPVGPDALEGTVTNQLDVPLTDALLAYSNQVYDLGTIAPNATVRVDLSKNPRHLSGLLRDRMRNVVPQQWQNTSFTIDRRDLMLALMFTDTQASSDSETAVSNHPLHHLDLTGQLMLGRPMLVARIERQGSRLVLGNAPRPPLIDQTTLLRVILPLNNKPGEAVGETTTRTKGPAK